MNRAVIFHAAKSIIPLGVGAFALYHSRKLTFGTWNNPGPGMWPTCLSIAIIVLSLFLLLTNKPSEEDESFTRDSRFSLYGALSLGMFILLFNQTGLILPALLLFIYWIRFLGKEGWKVSILVSIGMTALIYGTFTWGLHIPFPHDVLLSLLE
jgi:hypothetical protein